MNMPLRDRRRRASPRRTAADDTGSDPGEPRGRVRGHSSGDERTLLATLEHILDSPTRTQRALQLLNPVLAAVVLTTVSVALILIVVCAAAPWLYVALLGLASSAVGTLRWYRRQPPPQGDDDLDTTT